MPKEDRPRWWWSRARVEAWHKADRQRRIQAGTLPPHGVLACTHWEKRGILFGFGDYRLASFDKGRTWWSVVPDGSGVEPADPALLRRLAELDAAVRFAEEQPWLNRLSAPDDGEVYGKAGVAPEGGISFRPWRQP